MCLTFHCYPLVLVYITQRKLLIRSIWGDSKARTSRDKQMKHLMESASGTCLNHLSQGWVVQPTGSWFGKSVYPLDSTLMDAASVLLWESSIPKLPLFTSPLWLTPFFQCVNILCQVIGKSAWPGRTLYDITETRHELLLCVAHRGKTNC